jgi:hypothetical protein
MIGTIASICKNGNDLLGSINDKEILCQLCNYQLFKKDSVP